VLGDPVEVAGFSDTPGEGIVTLATCGLADLGRKHGFARADGYAQEFLLVIEGKYLTEDLPDFFFSVLIAYAEDHRLLQWDEAVRLRMNVPGSTDMSWLHPWPAVYFSDSFQSVSTAKGETATCLMIPMREDEALAASKLDVDELCEKLDQLQPEVWALDRPRLDLGS